MRFFHVTDFPLRHSIAKRTGLKFAVIIRQFMVMPQSLPLSFTSRSLSSQDSAKKWSTLGMAIIVSSRCIDHLDSRPEMSLIDSTTSHRGEKSEISFCRNYRRDKGISIEQWQIHFLRNLAADEKWALENDFEFDGRMNTDIWPKVFLISSDTYIRRHHNNLDNAAV